MAFDAVGGKYRDDLVTWLRETHGDESLQHIVIQACLRVFNQDPKEQGSNVRRQNRLPAYACLAYLHVSKRV